MVVATFSSLEGGHRLGGREDSDSRRFLLGKVDALADKLAQARRTQERTEAELRHANSERARLAEALGDLQETAGGTRDLRAKLEKRDDRIKKLENERYRLEQKLKNYQEALQDAGRAVGGGESSADLERARTKIRQLEELIQMAFLEKPTHDGPGIPTGGRGASEGIIEALNAERDAANAARAAAEQRVVAAGREVAAARQQTAEALRQREAAEYEAAGASSRLQAALAGGDAVAQEREHLRRLVANLGAQVEAMVASRLKSYEAELARMEKENASLRAGSDARMARAEKLYSAKEEECKKLQGQVVELAQQIADMRTQYQKHLSEMKSGGGEAVPGPAGAGSEAGGGAPASRAPDLIFPAMAAAAQFRLPSIELAVSILALLLVVWWFIRRTGAPEDGSGTGKVKKVAPRHTPQGIFDGRHASTTHWYPSRPATSFAS